MKTELRAASHREMVVPPSTARTVRAPRCPMEPMERRGLRDRPGPKDRRATLLYVTPKAQPLVDQIWELADGLASDMLEGVSAEDREKAHEVLTKMRANFLRIEAAETDDCRAVNVEWTLEPTTKG